MKRVTIEITQSDIDQAKCGNRSRCVLANAMNRIFALQGHGYICVDGAGAAFTKDGVRYRHQMPKTAIRYLRDFDLIGMARGEDAAREAMELRTFEFKRTEVCSIPPKASEARKARINQLRNEKRAAATAEGRVPAKPHKRYAGV